MYSHFRLPGLFLNLKTATYDSLTIHPDYCITDNDFTTGFVNKASEIKRYIIHVTFEPEGLPLSREKENQVPFRFHVNVLRAVHHCHRRDW